jgi:16S rRNA (cytosine967-C5)-methyltransferase
LKLHPLLLQAVAKALAEIFSEGKKADKVIEKLLRSNPKWGSRDRGFIAEQTYECVRWWRLLWHLSGAEISFESSKLIQLVGINLIRQGETLPEWNEFQPIKHLNIPEATAQITQQAIQQSIPDWMDQAGTQGLGAAAWATEIAALNIPALMILRANTLKIGADGLKKELAAAGWETTHTSLTPDALVSNRRGNIFATEAFKKGLFEVQDAGSQCIAPYLDVQPGMRVIDACAGAGGKTLQLACLMQNKGKIIAMDTEEWKLEELKKRAKRNGIHIIETKLIESTKTIKRLHDTADRILLDVPCSGIGVLRRNPDSKWKLNPQFLNEVQQLQQRIIRDYSKMLRTDGKMVYATCSILPTENENQITQFLKENPHFNLQKQQILRPSTHGFDGFYMAQLSK